MGRVIQLVMSLFDQWESHCFDQKVESCFRDINAEAITDIDKFLRSHGLLP